MDKQHRGREASSNKVVNLNARRYKSAVLDTYDRLQREMDRAKREQRADIERRGRESL